MEAAKAHRIALNNKYFGRAQNVGFIGRWPAFKSPRQNRWETLIWTKMNCIILGMEGRGEYARFGPNRLFFYVIIARIKKNEPMMVCPFRGFNSYFTISGADRHKQRKFHCYYSRAPLQMAYWRNSFRRTPSRASHVDWRSGHGSTTLDVTRLFGSGQCNLHYYSRYTTIKIYLINI